VHNIYFLTVPSATLTLVLTLATHMNWVSGIKTQSDADQAKTQTVIQQKKDAEIARQRVSTGCLKIVSRNSSGTFVQIKEGMPIFGHSSQYDKTPAADGTVVCDAYGGTGVVKDGKVRAFASDPSLKQ
jgi:hypothetical protein